MACAPFATPLSDWWFPTVACDSGSMSSRIIEPGASTFVAAGTPVVTRWTELQKLTDFIVDLVTCTTPAGVDCHFLNRGGA